MNFGTTKMCALVVLAALVIAASFPLGGRAQSPAVEAVDRCVVGTYLLEDGTDIDIGPGEGEKLRWRRKDGTTGELARDKQGAWVSSLGWTGRPDGMHASFADCAASPHAMTFDGVVGRKLELKQIDTRFAGAGVTLSGRLTLPPGSGRIPLVVLIHGAEHSSALESYSLQRQFASEGIGVFAYDKRGTGTSGGRYTQDYLLLANDAIAAMREAKRLAGAQTGRVGYQAGSQGGWVAPLAARIEPVDFLVIGFGLAVSPLDEDREAIAFDMERNGFGPDVMAKAMRVADASAAILLSNFTTGYEELERIKQEYSEEAWFKHLRGNVTWYLLATPAEEIRRKGPELLAGVPMQYDPMPVLQNLSVPQLWILGGQDRDAPPAETLRRLSRLKSAGRPIATAVYPQADHGIYEYETKHDGERVSTRNPDGYFRMMRDYILRGSLEGSYGAAQLSD
ncbi:alpha/beta hydrolase family protein [Pseudoxanthomonas yeongjuensis]|uniref:alpha/beta hydrolase family protein n=1 Tax=Pseudoxanthomonas yeongjuensis TaxID=377616 RepID=UPI001FE4FB47|nr:alpha/beta fold hydrolase [Pseudoxanthomonas yeongjuensis]